MFTRCTMLRSRREAPKNAFHPCRSVTGEVNCWRLSACRMGRHPLPAAAVRALREPRPEPLCHPRCQVHARFRDVRLCYPVCRCDGSHARSWLCVCVIVVPTPLCAGFHRLIGHGGASSRRHLLLHRCDCDPGDGYTPPSHTRSRESDAKHIGPRRERH